MQKDQAAMQEFTGKGLQGVPSFLIGEEVVAGFDRARLDQLLSQVIIPCEKCSTKLRVPRGKGKLKVTCPHCQHQQITTA